MAKASTKYRKAIAVLMLMLSRKRSSRKLTADEKQRKMMLVMGCMHSIKQINAAIAMKAVDIYSLPPRDVPHGTEDSLGDDNSFNSYFLFRTHKVLCILHAMHLSRKIFFVKDEQSSILSS
jgi:hypothetical protein